MESVPLAIDDARHADVRPHELPAPPIGADPRLEAEIVRIRLLGRERRPGKHMPSPVEIDEREDLSSVSRVDAGGEPP